MSNIDVVQGATAAMERHDFDTARGMMTDDFTFSGPVPEPIDRDGFLGLMQAITTGIPDWTFGMRDFHEDGDVVRGIAHVGGTHTGTISLPFMGIPDLPATGRKAENPDEPVAMTVRAGKLANLHADVGPEGGVAGILRQLGATLPG